MAIRLSLNGSDAPPPSDAVDGPQNHGAVIDQRSRHEFRIDGECGSASEQVVEGLGCGAPARERQTLALRTPDFLDDRWIQARGS